MKFIFSLSVLCLTISGLAAQPDEYVLPELTYRDQVYIDDIRTVTFHPVGVPTALPVAQLGSGRLQFDFDDFDMDTKDYYYKVVLCNADWTPNTDFTEMDYINGFSSDRIRSVQNSFGTLSTFSHYKLYIPNENTRLTKSGNYLLKIYRNDDEGDLIITRRFMIYESKIPVKAEVTRSFQPDQTLTHQGLTISLDQSSFTLMNPMNTVKTWVLQNGRWDNAQLLPGPKWDRGQWLEYNFADNISFAAGKDFRPLDIRQVTVSGSGGIMIIPGGRDIRLNLMQDEPRRYFSNTMRRDANGRFVIGNPNMADIDIESDYARATFTLRDEHYLDGDVYVFGGLSDWRIDPRFKMNWDNADQAWRATVELKQGYYDYAYAFVPRGSNVPDMAAIDGDDYQSTNEYTILVYYRHIGGRYDRLIGTFQIVP